MKRNICFNLSVALGIALLLTGGVVIASRAQAQGSGPNLQEGLAPQFAVDTAFTYQGRLIQNGNPISDTCDFEFTLYDDNVFPAQVDGPVTQTNVAVQDGYFATEVDFGSDAFTGEGRQLEIAVRCPAGSGGYTTLSGLVMLHAAPYAHSLRPGAVISGDVSTGLLVRTGAGGTAQALLAHASSPTGQSSGVWGSTESEEGGAGVVGRAESVSGSAHGVFGTSFSSGGTGIYGTAPGTGTVGVATSGTGVTYGLYGQNASNSGAGVYGASTHATGTGVRGYSASGSGVEGYSDSGNGVVGSSTNGNGLWGTSTSGHAIWSEGDAHINGNLTWLTRTGYLSINPSAFQSTNLFEPNDLITDTNYVVLGNKLVSYDNLPLYFNAPVQLPHGSRVNSLTCYWHDSFSSEIDVPCRLYRADIAGQYTDLMAIADSSGSSGDGSTHTTVITYPMVYNNNYSYYLWVGLSGTSTVLPNMPEHGVYGATIAYEYTGP